MDIDLAALRMIEADKGIPVKDMIDTIRQALLSAYRHTEGHQPHASIDIDAVSYTHLTLPTKA